MIKTENVEMIDVSLLVPDENQPRKLFEPSKLANLKKSVEQYGIMSPLTVEKVGNKYLIVDGERRFRVASELKMKKVPAIIIAPQSEIDRLVQQFHIQEQHEGWTATEKAIVLFELAKKMGLTHKKAFELLGIEERIGRDYLAFANLIEKDTFQKNNIGIYWASAISGLKNTLRSIYKNDLEEDFDRNLEKKLERAVINHVLDGNLKSRKEIAMLKDAFRQDPKSFITFIETDATPMELFTKTKAKSAFHLRNLVIMSGFITHHINHFLEKGGVKLNEVDIVQIKSTHRKLGQLLNKVE